MTPNLQALPIDGLLICRPHQNDPHGFQSIYCWGRHGLSVIESPKWMRPGALVEIAVVKFDVDVAGWDADGIPGMTMIDAPLLLQGYRLNGYGTLDFFDTDAAAEFINKAAAHYREVAA